MKQTERIEAHEAQMRRLRQAINELRAAMDAFLAQQPEADLLKTYYESALWKVDFTADEAGRLPKDLQRGVLSEDGLYNLLEENDALLRMLAAAGETDV